MPPKPFTYAKGGKRKRDGEYSTTPGTLRNVARREADLDDVRNQNATTKAAWLFWKDHFLKAVQHVLNAKPDEAKRDALEKEFKAQSSNVSTFKRMNNNTHYAQQRAVRNGVEFTAAKRKKFYKHQERIFDIDGLNGALMPPNFIQERANVMVTVSPEYGMNEADESLEDGNLVDKLEAARVRIEELEARILEADASKIRAEEGSNAVETQAEENTNAVRAHGERELLAANERYEDLVGRLCTKYEKGNNDN